MRVPSLTEVLLLLGIHLWPLTTTEAFLSRGDWAVSARRGSFPERFVLQEKLTNEEIHNRLESQLTKLREKDRASEKISPEVRRRMQEHHTAHP